MCTVDDEERVINAPVCVCVYSIFYRVLRFTLFLEIKKVSKIHLGLLFGLLFKFNTSNPKKILCY